MSLEPYSFQQATDHINRAKVAQASAEDFRRDAAEKYAKAEAAYRMALAMEITRQHAEGVAWTVCQDLARGNERVAGLRMERDIAQGVLDAAEQASWRHTADRKALQALVEWSAKRDIAEGYGDTREPAHMETIGGRRAA